MPVRAPRICSCGKVVPSGQRCACQVKRAREREQTRPTARQRGYTSRWDRESRAFLALPGNERCACGCGKPANVVDHHKAHKGDQALFWDRSNWRPMSLACNSRKAVTSEGGFGRSIAATTTPTPSQTFQDGGRTAWGPQRKVPPNSVGGKFDR